MIARMTYNGPLTDAFRQADCIIDPPTVLLSDDGGRSWRNAGTLSDFLLNYPQSLYPPQSAQANGGGRHGPMTWTWHITERSNDNMSWRNQEAPPELQPAERQHQYPYIQWHHGTGNGSIGVVASGGWLLDIENATAAVNAPTAGRHWGTAYAFPSLNVAVLATRTSWYTGGTADPKLISRYEPGAWSRLHVLAYVQELEAVAILTLRSTASRELGNALREYHNGALRYARRENRSLPPCAFWLTVQAGRPTNVGSRQKSTVTPPDILLPDGNEEAIAAWLDASFIGDDLLRDLATYADDIAAFRAGPQHAEEAGAPAPAPAAHQPTDDGSDPNLERLIELATNAGLMHLPFIGRILDGYAHRPSPAAYQAAHANIANVIATQERGQ